MAKLTIKDIVEGFCAKTLPKEAWTHEAHLLTGLWHTLTYGKEEALERMRVGIKTYNESVGGINSETSGYHETITVFWMWLLDEFQKDYKTSHQDITNIYEDYITSRYASREMPFLFYSKERLMSVAGRLGYVAPDLAVLDFAQMFKPKVPMNIPFQAIDWNNVPKTEHQGETGVAYWQTLQFDGLRVRIVTYSAGYLADHWCKKGHIVHCLEGEFVSELATGEKVHLKQGMSYIVSDDLSSHRSISEKGVKLMIIDGDFLKLKG